MFLPPIFNGTLPHKTSMIRVRPLKAAIIWQIFDGVGWVGINLKNPFLWGIPKTKNDTSEDLHLWRDLFLLNQRRKLFLFEVFVIHNSCCQGKARKTNGVAPHASAALVPQTMIAVWQFLKKSTESGSNHLQKPLPFTRFTPTQKIPLTQKSLSHWILIDR